MGTIGTQAELARIPLADGTLVATPEMPADNLIPSLLAASDVLGTGWFGAVAADVRPGKTVAVVGDGAVGLLAVLAARQLGADRIIAMSRHESRQKLALDFGATDVVSERGDGVATIKELTGGLGAHSVIEAVGTQESMLQAIRSARPGGHVGFVGVAHGVELPGEELFSSAVHSGLLVSNLAVATLDTASDPHPAPYPYGPFGSAQRDRTANGPEALGQLIRAHANAAKETSDGVHPAR